MGLFVINYGTILIILFGLTGWFFFSTRSRHGERSGLEKPTSMLDMEYYLYKMARVTGHSEYDIFMKSAENLQLTKDVVEKDFSAYLQRGSIPRYVKDFVISNKHHLDELRMPLW